MATPIQETPVLYNEEAFKFDMAVINVKPLPDSSLARINAAYEKVSKQVDFPL